MDYWEKEPEKALSDPELLSRLDGICWSELLVIHPQPEKYCPQWSFRLDEWAELLRAQEHFFKRCSNICHVLISYPDLYESWKKEDWSNYRITARSAVPYPKENHSLQEWYQFIKQEKSKCVICDCLLELLLQYPEIFAQWCKFGTGSLYQPVYWNLTMI